MNKPSRLGGAKPLTGIAPSRLASGLKQVGGITTTKKKDKKDKEDKEEETLTSSPSMTGKMVDTAPTTDQYTLHDIINQSMTLISNEDVVHLHNIQHSVIVMYVIF